METLNTKTYTKPEKFVYYFAAGEADGNASMKNILGGKIKSVVLWRIIVTHITCRTQRCSGETSYDPVRRWC